MRLPTSKERSFKILEQSKTPLAVGVALLVILFIGCTGQPTPTPATTATQATPTAVGERTDLKSTPTVAKPHTAQTPTGTGVVATPTTAATTSATPGETDNAYESTPRDSDYASGEEYLAAWVSQLPQTEQDCLPEMARAGTGWPDINADSDDPIVHKIFPCLSDSSLAFIYFIRFIQELMGDQLIPESRECLMASPLGGLTRKVYTDSGNEAAQDDVFDTMLEAILFFCLTHEEASQMGEDISQDELQTYKCSIESVGGLHVLMEAYSSTGERILSRLEEKAATGAEECGGSFLELDPEDQPVVPQTQDATPSP